MRTLLIAGLICLGVAAGTGAARAQSDCSKIVPASPFGPDDQTGATNRVTPAVVKAAAEIQEGKVISLTHPLVDGVPLFGTRFTKAVLTAGSLAPRRRARQERRDLHGGYLAQPKPRRHPPRRPRPLRAL